MFDPRSGSALPPLAPPRPSAELRAAEGRARFLPARLERSTLGDLLGSLHRGRANGRLELVEVEGPTAGARRTIHLADGAIVRVDGSGLRGGFTMRTEMSSGRCPGVWTMRSLSWPSGSSSPLARGRNG